ncbi:MAG: hypothetical protein LBQ50_02675 [Planctomycetaceae bacterium]|jgi:hypothetical protein|nr:hypothetical protein [Planctomycetaceae bacterium]
MNLKCCREDSWFLHDLPFFYDLIFDYYDGPLEGVTSCGLCGQGYYYKLLAWDNDTLDYRVFNFSEIDFTGEQLAEILGIKEMMNKCGGIVPPQTPQYLDIKTFSSSVVTHLCTSDNGFRTGFWRRIVPSALVHEC